MQGAQCSLRFGLPVGCGGGGQTSKCALHDYHFNELIGGFAQTGLAM